MDFYIAAEQSLKAFAGEEPSVVLGALGKVICDARVPDNEAIRVWTSAQRMVTFARSFSARAICSAARGRSWKAAAKAKQAWESAASPVCVAGGFTCYDVHAVREHRRSIDLVRYWFFGKDLLGLETVASVAGGTPTVRRTRRYMARPSAARGQAGALEALAEAVDDVLMGLGDGVSRVQRKRYQAYWRLRNFACVCPPQKTKLLVYLKADPKVVDLVPGFTRDVTRLGHHGTGSWRYGCVPSGIWSWHLFRVSYVAG